MRRVFAYTALMCCLCLVSCSGGVIPPGKMSRITEDMVLADFWLRQHPELRQKADTMLVYDAVFRKHNCTFEQYDRSLVHYSKDVDKYEELVEEARNRVRKKINAIEKAQTSFSGELNGEPQPTDTTLYNEFEEVL